MNNTSLALQNKTTNVLSPTLCILQRNCACGNKTVASEECTVCANKKNRLQRKLAIGASNDPLEQEADRVADHVMAMPTSSNICSALPRIQRLTGQPIGQVDTAHVRLDSVLASSGRPLEPVLRQDMEQRFGQDFSQVRIHSCTTAAQSARDVNAYAYTAGHNIVFAKGQFAPGTYEGRRLIAHELTHVVQQSGPERIRFSQSEEKHGLYTFPAVQQNTIYRNVIQRAAPAVGIGVIAARCIIGAIIGALLDVAIQSALHAWRRGTWRFWRASYNYCSIILSAILGCIAAPISAFVLEGWVAARLGSRLGGMVGTLIGKILLFIAKKLAIGIPKTIVGKLAKLGCISPEQSAELGVVHSDEAG